MKKPIFIIEHLEPRVWKWCLIEYSSISRIVGKENLWFTNIKRGSRRLKEYGRVFKESIKEMNLNNACVLDPQGQEELSAKDAAGFDYFIFGGILGDYPQKKRTKKELTKFIENAEVRSLGKKQMATDNAVYVVNEIVKGKEISELKFKNKAVIKINEIESVILPFKYVVVNDKPFMREEIINYLKRKKGF